MTSFVPIYNYIFRQTERLDSRLKYKTATGSLDMIPEGRDKDRKETEKYIRQLQSLSTPPEVVLIGTSLLQRLSWESSAKEA